jgi:hypothetical protein
VYKANAVWKRSGKGAYDVKEGNEKLAEHEPTHRRKKLVHQSALVVSPVVLEPGGNVIKLSLSLTVGQNKLETLSPLLD